MEFLVLLWALYLVQCVTWLPAGDTLFVRPWAAWVASEGPGWRLLHPLPSAETLRGARFPLRWREGAWFGRGRTTWWMASDWTGDELALDAEAVAKAAAEGAVVRIDGRPVARAANEAEAAELAALLRHLPVAGAEPDLLGAWFRERLSIDAFGAARERVAETTRWLGLTLDLYFAAGWIALPLVCAWIDVERVLLAGAPGLLVLHLLCLALFARAHRRLQPCGWIEGVLSAALYPPLLLRARDDLAAQAVGRFHPAAIAAVVSAPPEREAVLRRELLRARREAASHELAALRRLAEQLGTTEEALLAAPSPRDEEAQAYCPQCHAEYRWSSGECGDCRIPLVAFPDGGRA